MADKIRTIRDSNGDVWTGRSEDPVTGPTGSFLGDMFQLIGTGGISGLFYKDHATVDVNGEEHFGEVLDEDHD